MGALIAPSWERNLIAKALRGLSCIIIGANNCQRIFQFLKKHNLLFCNFIVGKEVIGLILSIFRKLLSICSV
jgi:hypothetical protein